MQNVWPFWEHFLHTVIFFLIFFQKSINRVFKRLTACLVSFHEKWPYADESNAKGVFVALFPEKVVSAPAGYCLSRRRFLGLSATAAATILFPVPGIASPCGPLSSRRSLSLFEIRTGERLETTYFEGGRYMPQALAEIDFILRDHYTGEIKTMDTRLLDLLYAVSVKLKPNSPFHIISGYRSRSTNDMLRRRSKRVAKKSLHMYGKAVDIRLPGCKTSRLRRVAIALKGGGVGYYRGSNFVHVDTGEIRYW
jgi:uncharacterized protein YcbK (DUF882 family)